MIWSGTWQFTADQIRQAAGPVRDRLLVLASEKNVAGLQPPRRHGRRRRVLLVIGRSADGLELLEQARRDGERGTSRPGSLDRPGGCRLSTPASSAVIASSPRNGETLRTEFTSRAILAGCRWVDQLERVQRELTGRAKPPVWQDVHQYFARRPRRSVARVLGIRLGQPNLEPAQLRIGVASAAGGALVALIALVLVRAARGERRRRPVRPGLEE